MEESTWDIMKDLQFLIATDDTLQDELTHVCDLLDSDTPSPDELSTDLTIHPTNSKKRRVRVNTNKAEMIQLREQVNTLKARLQQAKDKYSIVTMSTWQKAAQREREEVVRCQMENQELRAAIEERSSFIEHMKRLISKKPRFNAQPDTEEWQSYKLAAHSSLRVAAIHAIADRQYRRQNSAYIQAGILDLTTNVMSAGPVTLPGNKLVMEVKHSISTPAPFRDVSEACWRTFRGERHISLPADVSETIEIIDDHTIYERFSHSFKGFTGHSNNIRKYYPEEDRSVFVWRTVLEDALVPHMSKGAVDDTWGWLVVSPDHDNQDHTRMIGLFQIPYEPHRSFPALENVKENADDPKGLVAVVEAINTMKIGNENDYGRCVNIDLDIVQHPAMRALLERGKYLDSALKAALTEVVANFAKDT